MAERAAAMNRSGAQTLPAGLRRRLEADSLVEFWQAMRLRLERSGHAIRGTLEAQLDEDGADRLSGLLGHRVAAGAGRVRLADLDAALRTDDTSTGLVDVVVMLTGSSLRDRPAEREVREPDWRDVWRTLEASLSEAGLSGAPWVPHWTDWLHRGGLLSRLGTTAAEQSVPAAVKTLAELSGVLGPEQHGAGVTSTPAKARPLGELAARCTGTPTGLDDSGPTAALVLRAAAIAFDVAAPVSTADRRLLWQRLGVSTDAVSGTVLTWGLRPPGRDRWSTMMRERAELGLVSHLTVLDLRGHDVAMVAADAAVHACESPQVLQAAAKAGVRQPVICTAGSPTAAAILLLSRVTVRYHGDFDWPGIAIARRVFGLGAHPWRMACTDYGDAVAHIRGSATLPLTGTPQATPWDDDLMAAMSSANVAVHEASVIDLLLADLNW
jgi:uncharacterized protein (TIGR02679 family)